MRKRKSGRGAEVGRAGFKEQEEFDEEEGKTGKRGR